MKHARPMHVAILQLGSARGGIRRYGRMIAGQLAKGPDVSTSEVEMDLGRKSTLAALGACLRAAWRVRRADAAIVPYSPYLWGARRIRFLQAALIHLALRRRTVVVLHDLYQPARKGKRRLRPDAERLALAVHLRLAGAVVVHGEQERARLAGVSGAERVRVIPMFIEQREPIARAAARRALGLSEGEYVVSVLGYIHPRKGHRLMVDALTGLDPSVRLQFIGQAADGAEALVDELEVRAAEVGVASRVTITGYVDEAALGTYLAATDLAACPFEDVSASASVATWLSARRPLLATDLPALRELADAAPGAMRLTERSEDAIRRGVNDARAAGAPAPFTFDPVLADRSLRRTGERYVAVCEAVAGRESGGPAPARDSAGDLTARSQPAGGP